MQTPVKGRKYSSDSFIRFLAEMNLNFKFTSAFYQLPSQYYVEGRGISPDIECYLSPSPKEDEKVHMRIADEVEGDIPLIGDEYRPEPTWTDFVSKVSNCMKQLPKNPEALYAEYEKEDLGSDYPVISAQAALICLDEVRAKEVEAIAAPKTEAKPKI